MIELFAIYKYAFVLAAVAAILLSTQGIYTVARGEVLQSLPLAQGALVGNLLTRILFPHGHHSILILVGTFLFFVGTKLFFFYLAKKVLVTEIFFIMFYLLFMALCYLLITLFPTLDSHMAQGLFGDIVSISRFESVLFAVIFAILLLLIFWQRKSLLRHSFSKTVLVSKEKFFFDEIIFASGIVLSLYALGQLFTLATLIFPPVIIGRLGKNFASTVFLVGLVSSLAATVGLSLSIWSENLSTTPTQVLLLAAGLFLTGLVLIYRIGKA